MVLTRLLRTAGRRDLVDRIADREDVKALKSEHKGNGRRVRPVRDHELLAIGHAIEKHRSLGRVPVPVLDLIWFMALSGVRTGEARDLEWDEVDFNARRLNLKKSKTGASRRALGKTALAFLGTLKRKGRYVFAADEAGEHAFKKSVTDFRWENVRATAVEECASCADIVLHDFRHVATSIANATGHNAVTTAKVTGHADPAMLKHYDDGEIEAALPIADEMSATVLAKLTGKTAEIATLPKRKGKQ
jgi:integrase